MGIINNADIYLPRESISESSKIIDPVHGTIHDGTHFTASYYNASANTAAVSITAPAASEEKYIHFVAGVECDGPGVWYFCKGSVGTAISGGTVLTSYNNKQSSSITTPATVLKDVVVTTTGTVLETHIMGSGENPNSKTGGEAEARNEWMLESGATYFLYVVADGASKVVINFPYYYRTKG